MREAGERGLAGEGDDEHARVQRLYASAWQQLGHELRTPLNAILGNVELLLDGSAGPVSEQARACLGDVQSAGRQLLKQMQDVLLLLQASSGRPPTAEVTVDLLQLMRRALARSTAGAGWEIRPAEARMVLRGDPFWLDALAQAMAEAARAGEATEQRVLRILVEPPLQCSAGGLEWCIGWSSFDPARLQPIALVLIDAILRGHGGRAWPVAGHGLHLHWPAARVVVR